MPALSPILLVATATVVTVSNMATCPAKFKTVQDIGLTADGKYLAKYTLTSPEACCEACVNYTGTGGPCTTYTFHSGSQVCTVAADVDENPRKIPSTTSGSSLPIPPPGPQPPSPSPKPP
eukprot:gene30738-30638_t